MEEWHTPCHGIPQFEYTHYNLRQLVQSVVKQEELPDLKTAEGRDELLARGGSTVRDLPKPVLDALLGMPVTNQRSGGKGADRRWYEYYDQESLNLTFELYQHDFEVFRYSPTLEERPDLVSPEPFVRPPPGPPMPPFAASSASSTRVGAGPDFGDDGVAGSNGLGEHPQRDAEPGAADYCGADDRDAKTDPAHSTSPSRGVSGPEAGSSVAGSGGAGAGSSSSSSAAAASSSSVELMRRNSKEGEPDRGLGERMDLLVSSSRSPSRTSSMRREPVFAGGTSSSHHRKDGSNASSLAASSLASSLSSSGPPPLPAQQQQAHNSASPSFSLPPSPRLSVLVPATLASPSS
jgi:hypothetical protein